MEELPMRHRFQPQSYRDLLRQNWRNKKRELYQCPHCNKKEIPPDQWAKHVESCFQAQELASRQHRHVRELSLAG